MFQGRVYSYRNINGQEKTFEKSFDNFDDYKAFIDSDSNFRNFATFPSLGFRDFDSFEKSFDNFFHSRYELPSVVEKSQNILPVSLDKYETEAQRIKREEKEAEHKKTMLEKAKEKLQWYLTQFQSRKTKDDRIKQLLEDAKADMKKIDEELQKINS